MISPEEILSFWFNELSHKERFSKDEKLDEAIASRFGHLIPLAMQGELFEWRVTPSGRLAEIILLDQFSRNIYRNNPKAFSADPLALILAQEMVFLGWDQKIEIDRRAFVYMPYMHSESPVVHKKAMELFSIPGLESNLDYEIQHKDIIERFGRYPHRNSILGRNSTPEEIDFLKDHPGF